MTGGTDDPQQQQQEEGGGSNKSTFSFMDETLVPPHFFLGGLTTTTSSTKAVSSSSSTNNNTTTTANVSLSSVFSGEGYRDTLLRLAKWSLEDYEWRSAVFKANEADRMVEETLARMQGKPASYVRPMDAGDDQIGPLGMWEKSAVAWLSNVIDEEGRRAQQIIDSKGQLIRPIQVGKRNNNNNNNSNNNNNNKEEDYLGPLGQLERTVVEFLNRIRSSEGERVRTQTLRPKDLEESKRGPLGQWEEGVSNFIAELRASEMLRYQQSQSRGGAMVRPIDVPGPMGELELWIGQVLRAEELRAEEQAEQKLQQQQQRRREKQQQTQQIIQGTMAPTALSTSVDESQSSTSGGRGGGGSSSSSEPATIPGLILRPKDAKIKGPLGEVEERAYEFLDRLSAEEMERLRNMEQYLRESRPMEKNPASFWGAVEALIVGLVRGPILLFTVVARVVELLYQSEILSIPVPSSMDNKEEEEDDDDDKVVMVEKEEDDNDDDDFDLTGRSSYLDYQ